MFKLSDKTKELIERRLGITRDEMSSLDMAAIEKKIENKIGKKLEFMTHTDDRLGRGNIYSFLSRMINISKIDKKLSKI